MNLNNGGLLHFISRNAFSEAWQEYILYFGFVLIVIAAGYLLGSLNSSIIVSRVIFRDDIRKHGSGNAGLTNTLRTYGKGAALLTLFGDILKTALAVAVAGVLFGFNYVFGAISISDMCYVAGLFAVLGHIFPVYYKFKGGKGVLATATMVLILAPACFLILFLVFVAVVAMSKFVSLGSVCAAVLLPVIISGYFRFPAGGGTPGLVALSTIILAIIIVWCHRENLKRISERTERKLSFKKKPEVTKPKEDDKKNADGDGE